MLVEELPEVLWRHMDLRPSSGMKCDVSGLVLRRLAQRSKGTVTEIDCTDRRNVSPAAVLELLRVVPTLKVLRHAGSVWSVADVQRLLDGMPCLARTQMRTG